MDKKLVKLSKAVSYALRHKPEKYGLVLDADGRVLLADLLNGISAKHKELAWATRESIEDIIRHSDKKRFELIDDSIRALYGHSVQETIQRQAEEPPEILYHGTTEAAAKNILQQGLKPMGRQYVHLSIDIDNANIVARRRTSAPVILKVAAKAAFSNKVGFYIGHDAIWLADEIPPEYISACD